MNISSIVVRTAPEHLDNVINDINGLDRCEVHFSDPDGKIVVTVEGESLDEQIASFKLIQKIPFVFNANVAYSYCEDEVENKMERILTSPN